MGFWNRNDGNMVMVFALALIPIVSLVGFAVDSSRQHSAAKALQQSVDAAVLSVGRTFSDSSMTEEQRTQMAKDLVLANYSDQNDVTLAVPVVTYPEDNAIKISVTGTLPTTATAIMGVSELKISGSSGAKFASPSVIEAALVLDVTGSMEGTPLADLKTAAKQFAKDLLDTSRPDIKIGLVPFAQHVNVGMDNRGADWIDVASDYDVTETECYSSGCTCLSETTSSWTDPETGETHSSTSCSSWDCSSATEVCDEDTDSYEWYGCVKSRAKPYNVQDTRWDIDAEGFLTEYRQDCPDAPIVPLTNVQGTLISAINGLTADDLTYMPAGISWGMRVLSPEAPFTGALDTTTFESMGGTKLLVLMTDGANTRSLSSDGRHKDSDIDDANAETLLACTEVKTAGIDLFVIAFNVTDADTIAMLQSCATTFTHFSAVTDLATLTAAFKSAAASVGDVMLFE